MLASGADQVEKIGQLKLESCFHIEVETKTQILLLTGLQGKI